MKKTFKGGFTLIELLVVIAIIGILASVVLASLNAARNKGADAAIKAQLANARAQAEIFYGIGNNYGISAGTSGVCFSSGVNSGIQDLVQASMKNYNGTTTITTTLSSGGTSTTGVCHNTDIGWAAAIPLKSPAVAGNVWCVDSTGVSKETTTGVAGGAVICS